MIPHRFTITRQSGVYMQAKIRRRFYSSVGVGFLALLSCGGMASAQTNSFPAINFQPATDPHGYVTVAGSQTLTPKQFNFGFYLDYSRDPLECDGCPQEDVIHHLLVGNFGFAIGVIDWFELSLNIPAIFYNQFHNDVTGGEEFDGGMGDIYFSPKFRVVNIDEHRVGFSVAPFVTIPTGDPDSFMGTAVATGGLKLITDFDIVPERFDMALNLGYLMRDDVTRTNTRIDDELTYGIAAAIHATEHFDVLPEVSGYTVLRDAFQEIASSPVEANVGLRYNFTSGFAVTAGGGVGIVDGVGSPTFRSFLGLNFSPPVTKSVKPDSPSRAKLDGRKIVITDMIHFDFDKATIKPESLPILDDVAKVMAQNSQVELLLVEGHTDSVGTDAYNQRLSEARAKAAQDYLVQVGVAAERLQYAGKGESAPIDTNATSEGRTKNRRTEFIVLRMKGDK